MFASLDWRRHLHEWEAATDNVITPPAEADAAIAAMRAFTPREQHHFLGNWDFYLNRCRAGNFLGPRRRFRACRRGWRTCRCRSGSSTQLGIAWGSVDYGSGTDDLRPMVRSAPQPGRDAVRGAFFQSIFEQVCDNATIETAANDLGLTGAERTRWIESERALI